MAAASIYPVLFIFLSALWAMGWHIHTQGSHIIR